MEKFIQLGEKFGLEGEKLLEFVREQEEKEEKRRQLEKEEKRRQLEEEKEEKRRQLEEEKEEKRRRFEEEKRLEEEEKEERRRRQDEERETRRLERELRKLEKEAELVRQKEAAEAAKREHELELARLGQGNLDNRPRDREDRAKAPKLPSFVDGKDDLDAYLQRFERFAETAKWNKIGWASKLSALLSGRALEVYSRLSEEAAKDYDKVKIALMKRYDLTEDGYRRKFRASKPEADESPEQFIVRLDRYLLRWLELSDTEQTFGGLKDLIVKEQFIDSCPKDLAIHLRERAPDTLAKIAKIADQYLEAHGKHLFTPASRKPTVQPERDEAKNMQSNQTALHCFKCNTRGHKAVNCPIIVKRCFLCGKQGHEARNCRLGGRRPGGQSKDGNPVQRGQVSASCLVQPPDAKPTEEEVTRLLSIKQLTTTPYHPMCNGLTEKFNGTMKSMLKRLCSEQPRQWHRYINPLLFAYREVPQESTGFSPFELLYGRAVRGPMLILKELWTKEVEEPEVKNSYQYVFELREKLEDTLKLAHTELQKAQLKGKHYYDRKTKVRKFAPGDKVLVLLPTDHNKLLMQWKGPFEVSAVMGLNDYRVRVKGKERVYHANLLKKYFEREDSVGAVAFETNSNICKHEHAESEIEEVDPAENIDFLEIGGYVAKESVKDVAIGDNLSYEQREEFMDLANEFQSLFTEAPGTTSLAQHHIKLTSDQPVRSRPYPVPYSLRESLKKDITDMMKMGVIRESSSPYASPVVVVKKKDNTNRICVDYRRLNKLTIFDPEPMPTAEHLFQKLNGDKYFTRIDLSKGYWQISIPEGDIPKTAFVTPDGSYEFLKMPFGMINSAATLKRAMKKLLHGLDNVEFYWDDILVHTRTWEEHIKALRELFNRLLAAGMTIRPTKCLFGVNTVDFLGHRLEEGLIGLHEDNVTKIRDAPRPTTKKQIKSFMGLAGYYRDFIPNFAALAAPLSDLTRKGQPNKVEWGEAQEKAYQSIKAILTKEPVLRLPDPTKTYFLQTDASNSGIGAVLMQKHDGKLFPVCYASKKLSSAERNYSTIEKECLAIVWGFKRFHLYLYGVSFVLQTDHEPLKYMNSAKFANGRLMRWAMFLQSYNFRVEAIKGSENVGADYLSRVEE